jgi:transposase
LVTGFRHRNPQQQQGGERTAGQKHKCRGEPGVVDNKAGDRIAERGASEEGIGNRRAVTDVFWPIVSFQERYKLP